MIASVISEGLNVFNTVAKHSAATPWPRQSSIRSISMIYGTRLTSQIS